MYTHDSKYLEVFAYMTLYICVCIHVSKYKSRHVVMTLYMHAMMTLGMCAYIRFTCI